MTPEQLGAVLPERIRLLASLIARKPQVFTPEWAGSVDEAFHLYTRTSTVDLINSFNHVLIENDWPFPAFLDLKKETRQLRVVADMVTAATVADVMKRRHALDSVMVKLFYDHKAAVFNTVHSATFMRPKSQIVTDVEKAFKAKLWAACVTTTVPLLDCVVREFFDTSDLKVTIQLLRNAFIDKAKLLPKDVMPGHSVWVGQKNPNQGNSFASGIEEDLRLPGVLLASFLEFSDRYYEWYKSTAMSPRSPLNRHAVMHCASEFWTESNAVRMMMFLHLTMELEPVIRILGTGKAPGVHI